MKNKVVIVTGAFGALGRVVAGHLALLGARVALVDAAAALPPELQQRFESHLALPAVDLGNFDATKAMVARVLEHYAALDAIVNIAGGFTWETIEGGDPASWDRMYSLNVKTALHSCKAALPALLARGGGARIVNIGAGAAGKAALGMGAYAASKAGVMRLTEALAEETKDRGITVNAILPSIVDTPANRKDMPDADASRWVTPQAIAEVVAFLLSDGASAITGAGIAVNGRV